MEKILPFTKVKLRDKWCPSNRQPHVPALSGSPNMET